MVICKTLTVEKPPTPPGTYTVTVKTNAIAWITMDGENMGKTDNTLTLIIPKVPEGSHVFSGYSPELHRPLEHKTVSVTRDLTVRLHTI